MGSFGTDLSRFGLSMKKLWPKRTWKDLFVNFLYFRDLFVNFQGPEAVTWAFDRVWNAIWAFKGLFEEVLRWQGPLYKFTGTSLCILINRGAYMQKGIFWSHVDFKISAEFWDLGFWAFEMCTGHWIGLWDGCREGLINWALRFGLWYQDLGFLGLKMCTGPLINVQGSKYHSFELWDSGLSFNWFKHMTYGAQMSGSVGFDLNLVR